MQLTKAMLEHVDQTYERDKDKLLVLSHGELMTEMHGKYLSMIVQQRLLDEGVSTTKDGRNVKMDLLATRLDIEVLTKELFARLTELDRLTEKLAEIEGLALEADLIVD